MRQLDKLITCILPRGIAAEMKVRLKSEFNITRAYSHHARGIGKSAPLVLRGVGEQTEKDILCVVTTEDEAEAVFGFLYHESGINQPHGGIMYMLPLNRALPFELPSLPTV